MKTLEELEKELNDLYCRIGEAVKWTDEIEELCDQASDLDFLIQTIKYPPQAPYELEEGQCPYCFGKMTWCEGCNKWSSYCCETYGTCMCS